MKFTPRDLLAAFAILALPCAARAEIVFSDGFVAANGTLLNGSTPSVGSAWYVDIGAAGLLVISNNAVDTSSVGEYTFAFGAFTRSLASGETLTFTFNTGVSAADNFFSNGWAGLSLYTGGSGGDEQFFLGSPGEQPYWGIDGPAAGGVQTFTSITSAAQLVTFSYAYDTGAWSYSVGGSSKSGSAPTGLAFNTLRIGSDPNSLCSIKVEDVQVQFSSAPVPEPGTWAAASLLLAGAGVARWRRRTV